MEENNDARKYPRIRVRVPNSLRIRVKDGDCLADILDISQGGLGAEFFNLFDVLIFSEGDVVKLQFLLKPEQIDNENATEILDMVRRQRASLENKIEIKDGEEFDQEKLEADAKIVWTNLNRLGLEFIV
ncbi:MAG: PilZ domain-containing protein [Deltaproteobacteria bacterium]|nr:PilZ domain-containing protein [Deltaproteobacteria bacterium]